MTKKGLHIVILDDMQPFAVGGKSISVIFPRSIVGMEKLMSLASVGHAQEVLVQLFNGRVVVGFPDICISVFSVQSLGSLFLDIYPVSDVGELERLAASVYAASRTGHDLDEVEFFAGFYGIHQFPGVAEAVGHCGSYVEIVDGDGSYLDTLKAADVFVFEVIG